MSDLDIELMQHLQVPNSLIYLKTEGFTPDWASVPSVQSYAQWAFEYMARHGKPPGRAVIEREWEGIDEPEPELDVEYVFEQLKGRVMRKQARQIKERVIDASDEEFADVLIESSREYWESVKSTKHIASLDDYPEMIETFLEMARNKEVGCSFGFNHIDRHTGGAGRGHLVFIAARPKRFKSWLLLKAFVEQRRQGKCPVLFTLELSSEEMYRRLVCLVSGVSYNRMIRNELIEAEWKKIRNEMEKFRALGPAYIVQPPYDERQVEHFALEAQRLGADSVLIDQLSFVQWRGNHYRENEGYKEIVHDMKATAVRMSIPWICVCQFNREAAMLEDMAGAHMVGLTRAIEETCDLLIGLHRTEDEEDMDIVQMHIVEARHCPKGNFWDVYVDLVKRTSFVMED